MVKGKNTRPLQGAEYAALAEFRYHIRKFLRHMEGQVRRLGVNPQQYQVVLAVKGLPRGEAPTIGRLAERMQLNHNSMVELVDRCEQRRLLRRGRSTGDRRQVTLSVAGEGDALLHKLGSAAREELRDSGPQLVESVLRLIGAAPREGKTRKKPTKKAGS